jgi:hypothetical protein
MNVHLLLHVAECIRIHGIPRGFWSFAFERFYGRLKKAIHGNDVGRGRRRRGR